MMWLEATVWFWGPILGALTMWSFARHRRTMRQLAKLHERLVRLETKDRDPKTQRRAA